MTHTEDMHNKMMINQKYKNNNKILKIFLLNRSLLRNKLCLFHDKEELEQVDLIIDNWLHNKLKNVKRGKNKNNKDLLICKVNIDLFMEVEEDRWRLEHKDLHKVKHNLKNLQDFSGVNLPYLQEPDRIKILLIKIKLLSFRMMIKFLKQDSLNLQ